MEKEKQNKQNKPGEEKKQGYIIIPNYFLREWVKVLGVGPALLYLQLLSYCHKEKDLAWPTLATLSKKMQFTPKTITKYHQTLAKYGLIKKVSKRKTSPGCHMRNIYQLTPFDMGKNTLPIGNIFSYLEGKFTPDIGKNLPTNNNNLKHYQGNNNKEREDAAVVAVNFKKLKEKGEKRMRVIREQMVGLDFKEKFIEKILKEYSMKKIEEKLDLLMERKNIQNPAGWLRAALKNDYRGKEQESRTTPHPHLNPPPSRGRNFIGCPPPQKGETVSSIEYRVYSEEKTKKEMDSRVRGNDIGRGGNDIDTPEWTSREKALEAIKLIQDNLSLPVYPSLSPQGEEP
jgi:hypothetical protein